MAKRASKSNTKAAKADAEPTDDQKGSGVKAQTGAGETPAPAPKPAEKRIVNDTPPTTEADPADIAAELTSAPHAAATLTDKRGNGPKALTLEENAELSRQIKELETTEHSMELLDAYGPAHLQVTVVGPNKGFRRAGRFFGKEPVTIGADEITGRQFAALEAEPKLVVTLSEKPAAAGED